MSMPSVDFSVLESAMSSFTDEERAIVAVVVKKSGQVRATKPKVKDDISGKAAYVWRMVAFMVSRNRQHQCMPVTADFDLPARTEEGKWSSALAREMSKELKCVEDAIVNAIPKSQWYGVHRWGCALGYIS